MTTERLQEIKETWDNGLLRKFGAPNVMGELIAEVERLQKLKKEAYWTIGELQAERDSLQAKVDTFAVKLWTHGCIEPLCTCPGCHPELPADHYNRKHHSPQWRIPETPVNAS